MINFNVEVGMRFRFVAGAIYRGDRTVAVNGQTGTIRDIDERPGIVWVSFDHRPWRRRWVSVPCGLIEMISTLDELVLDVPPFDAEAEEYQRTAGRDRD